MWWLVAGATTLLLGWGVAAHGLWDPWETHYAEVARQIIVRGDPINLWWQAGEGPDGAAEGRFWSKPALAFWLMALSLRGFGLGDSSDPAELVAGPWTELAVRAPMVGLTVVTCVALGLTARRLAGPRAGLITAWTCATLPQLAMMGRMAVTDVPLVASLSWGLCAVAIAELDPDSRRPVERRALGWLTVPWTWWTVLAVVLLGLGAVAPIATIHMLSREWVQMLPYEIGLVIVVVGVVRAQTVRQLAWVCAHMCFGLSLVAKGLIGPALAAGTLVAFALLSRRPLDMARGALLGVGPLAFACVGFPWYHAMIVRKGLRFLEVGLVQHQLHRFATGEQTQATGTWTMYLRALGLAAFPYSALLPAAAIQLWPRTRRRDPASSLAVLALCWLGVTLVVLSVSATKYPHYLLPALPAVALLVGLALCEVDRWGRAGVVLGALVWAAVVATSIQVPGSFIHLTTYLQRGPWAQVDVDGWIVPVCAVPVGVALVLAGVGVNRRLLPTVVVVAGGLITAAVLHRQVPQASALWSQRPLHERLRQARAASGDAPVVAWRLNHRGETFYTKGRVWVSEHGDGAALRALLTAAGEPRAAFIITTPARIEQLRAQLPQWRIDVVGSQSRRVLLHARP